VAKHGSLFHKLVIKEDDYTQLLYNLMVRFDDFRLEVMSLFFEDKAVVAQIAADHLKTQMSHKGSGRPDLVIDSPSAYALLEVKLNERRGLTAYQTPVFIEEEEVTNYFTRVRDASAPNRAILFLVPEQWKFGAETKRAFSKLKLRTSVKMCIVSWHNVLDIANKLKDGRPGVEEFVLLLTEKLGPLNFTKQETDMLFKNDLPISEFLKLCFLVDQIKKRCAGTKIFPKIYDPKMSRDGDEYAFECYDSTEKSLLWFGIWSSYLKDTGKPLAFGFYESAAPKVQKAFLKEYKGTAQRFGSYTLVGMLEEDFLADGTGGDAEARVWRRIEPFLLALKKISPERK
jgi:hypothetical protein